MTNIIRVYSPRPNATISSPLQITGEARGTWFFEGDFPIILTNWDGLIIAEGFGVAQGEWMTEDFVPFKGTLTFEKQESYSDKGTLILQKDNPSDLRENDDALEIPVIIQ
ncbi:MAG: Gmad2 immunoglobulin-like domain-containing protein [Candidatus Magasanikbacteria bacterium]